MDDLTRQVLRQLLEQYGRDLATDRRRLKGLLLDYCGDNRAAVNLLVQAQETGIPDALLAISATMPPGVLAAQLRNRLESTYCTAPAAAAWAVETWALVLGVALPVQSTQAVTAPPAGQSPGNPYRSQRERQKPNLDEVKRAVARPEQQHLLDELKDTAVTHLRREAIGQRLAELGDPRPGVGLRADGLPDIAWCFVDVPEDLRGKAIPFDSDEGKLGKFRMAPFDIARYPITYAQFQAFLDHPNGFANPVWWRGIESKKRNPGEARRPYDNYPRDSVSWYDAIAFCRWLSDALGCEITLPTEQQWQWAAQNGPERREYPWGPWDGRRCNTYEAGIGRSTAVGMYPHGAAACGALDMAGTLWEWCLNRYDKPDVTAIDDSDARRVVRGGSWHSYHYIARAVSRYLDHPSNRLSGLGFRVVRPPSR